MNRKCGNPLCSVSTGISGHLTFGSGELDEHGYWEKPCWTCARASEKANPNIGACWPFENPEVDSCKPGYEQIHDAIRAAERK
jgi:hypothetical protein